jgi:tetratricopeptide (TPR) repeat protein
MVPDLIDTEVDLGLDGLEVAITGKLASMSRDDAVERLAAAGARYVASPTESTALLVVGQGGPPLGDDGRPTRHLQEARRLQAAGAAIEIVPEESFLARIGLDELARLAAAGVKPTRIRRSLLELEGWWPEAAEALAQLEAIEKEGPLLVRTPGGALAETSGQLRLDFDRPRDAPPTDEEAAQAELWFRRGIRLEEEERTEEAIVAYAKALGFGMPRAELAFNLGNVLYAVERPEEAAQCFALATEIDAEYVEAWNNLGNALARTQSTDRSDEALDAFRRALAIEPDYADAHYNLAESLAARGEIAAAREHWRAYLEQDPRSVWADEVRARLRRTESPREE